MEPIVPIGQHGLVVVGPTIVVGFSRIFAVGLHHLDVVYTNHGRQTAIVAVGGAQGAAGVVDGI